ncbi:MAG: hypothetical protein ACJATP_002747 [Candidatus Azotimanducaceae bacterium]|jgi:hypothetical protein
MKFRQTLTGICILAYFATACAAPATDVAQTQVTGTTDAVDIPGTTAERRALRLQMADRDANKGQHVNPAQLDRATPAQREVPDEILGKMMTDLAAKLNAPVSDISVVLAESLTWRDGSLGCGKPGQMYTQALIPGYRVILDYAGQPFDYRATEHGLIKLCERPTLVFPGAAVEPAVQ